MFIEEFLESIHLDQYVPLFAAVDVTSREQIKYLDKEILGDIGVTKLAHRYTILNKVSELRAEELSKSPSITTMVNSITRTIGVPELKAESSDVTFILHDGSMTTVNVTGCFNADSIKKKILNKLGLLEVTDGYDIFVCDSRNNTLHLLSNVELVTICHSPDRMERDRLLLVQKDQPPSEAAISASKQLYNPKTTMKVEERNNMRKVFNQRPPSEFISSNLPEYFPQANVKELRKTIRNSVRYSVRYSTIGTKRPDNHGNNVGDIMMNQSNALDSALLATVQDTLNFDDNKSVMSNFTLSSNRMSMFQENVSDDEEQDGEEFTLPTSVEAPKNWLRGARIGSGSFGAVYLGLNAGSGELMAVKQVELSSSPSDIQRKMIEALQHEMVLLKELQHENIVTYYGSSQEKGCLNIFLEYVPGGSISSMLQSYGPFEESLVKNFTRQVLIGLSYLHRKSIIHRDIKGANILIDIKGGVKITDFGISKKFNPSSSKRASLQGSVYWMAPEVVKQVATTDKSDIWSVGCVVIEMFTGKHPFPDFSQMQAIFKIGTQCRPDSPKWASKDAQQFLALAFEGDYKKRPSSSELLTNKFLSVV